MLFIDYELGEDCRHSFNLFIYKLITSKIWTSNVAHFKVQFCPSFCYHLTKQQSCRGHPAFVSVEQSSISCFITQLENKTSYHKPTKGSSYQNLESYHSLDLNQDGIFSWKIQSKHYRS